MILSYIWVVCWLSCSVSAVGVDEDGIALDDFAVGTSEWLPYWVEAMIIVGIELAFCQASTVSNDVSRRHQVASALASYRRVEIRMHVCVWHSE